MLTHRPARLALVVMVVAGLSGACAGEAPVPGVPGAPTTTSSPAPEPSPEPSAEVSAAPTASPATTLVQYLVDTRAGIRLAGERHELPGGDDAVRAALEQMIAGPDDPDYSTAWDPATRVLGVTRADGTITVDLSEEARTASIGSEGAATMVQQLVWTVTEAAGDPAAAVLLTLEGQPAGDLWGVVTWDEPVVRADPLDVRMLVQIDQPTEGATSPSPVTVFGDAAAFEANVPWRVLDQAGAEVATGFATTSEGQTFAPYLFTVDLPPGTWTIEISESDPSDGAGGTPMTDTRTVVVPG